MNVDHIETNELNYKHLELQVSLLEQVSKRVLSYSKTLTRKIVSEESG